jgi:hypothetical protein
METKGEGEVLTISDGQLHIVAEGKKNALQMRFSAVSNEIQNYFDVQFCKSLSSRARNSKPLNSSKTKHNERINIVQEREAVKEKIPRIFNLWLRSSIHNFFCLSLPEKKKT